MLSFIIKIILLPFEVIYMIFWKNIFSIDNFIIITKNTTTIYNTMKSMNLKLTEKEYWLY